MPEIKAGESIKLEHGMKLNFVATNAFGSTYKVKIANDPSKQQPQLTLLRIDDDPAYPEKVVVNIAEFKLGRCPDNAFARIATMSRQHAIIKQIDGSFIYEHKGQNAALIIPAAKNCLANLLHEIEMNLGLLEFTSNLEKDSGEIPIQEISIGGKTENALTSFILFLKAYRYLNFNQLQQKNELILVEKLITTLKQLKKQRIAIRKIQTNSSHKQDLATYNSSATHTYSYHTWLQEFVSQLYNSLLASEKKEVFLLGGTGDHNAIHKLFIHQQTGRYHFITYNAGLDTIEIGDSDKVMGIHETLLKVNIDVEKLLLTLYEKKLRSSHLGTSPLYQTLKAEFEAYLETHPIRYRSCSKQHRQNCTTRSIREMLRDNLSEQTFNRLLKFISSPKQILAELKSLSHSPKKEILEKNKKRPLLSISGEIFFTSTKSCKHSAEDTPSKERSHAVTVSSLSF